MSATDLFPSSMTTKAIIAKAEKLMKKERSLIDECKETAHEAYQEIMAALPDERTKDLFAAYTILHFAEARLGYSVGFILKPEYDLYVSQVKTAKKLLGKK